MNAPAPHNSRLVRVLLIGVGVLALALGVVGIFLPLLPTTPFVLLAAACFARSSRRLHDWLLAHRIAGPIIREWREHRSMPPGVKPWAFAFLAMSFGVSISVMHSGWHQAMLAILGAGLGVVIWRIPVRQRGNGSRAPSQTRSDPGAGAGHADRNPGRNG